MTLRSFLRASAVGGLALFAMGIGFPNAGHADTFNFTSCHVSGSTCEGGSILSPGFGNVTLTQSGADVNVAVTLINGNTFVETGAGGGELFLFNDTIANSAVTNATFTTETAPPSGIQGFTNLSPVHADGTGDFTSSVECKVGSECNGNSGMLGSAISFTVTNVTLAQLETANANGNLFVADILCGAAQTQCGGLTGPVDASVPGPILGGGLPGLVMACGGLVALARRRRQLVA